MIKAYFRGLIAAGAVLAASSAFAGANLIQDGDFSSPNFSGSWGFVTSPFMGWTTNDPGGDIEIGNSSVYGLPCDNSGCQNQEINANAFNTVSYTVTGLTVGKAYDLSWDYGGRASGGPDFLNVSFGGNLLVQDFGSVGHWTDNAFSVVATASSETLTFDPVDTSGSGGIPSYGNEITNVSLAVPEASTWAMMALGFVGLGFAAVRRARSTIALSL